MLPHRKRRRDETGDYKERSYSHDPSSSTAAENLPTDFHESNVHERSEQMYAPQTRHCHLVLSQAIDSSSMSKLSGNDNDFGRECNLKKQLHRKVHSFPDDDLNCTISSPPVQQKSTEPADENNCCSVHSVETPSVTSCASSSSMRVSCSSSQERSTTATDTVSLASRVDTSDKVLNLNITGQVIVGPMHGALEAEVDITAIKQPTHDTATATVALPNNQTAAAAAAAATYSAPLTLYDKLKQRRARQVEAKKEQEHPHATSKSSLSPESTSTGSGSAAVSQTSKAASRLERVQEGSRIAIYWDGEETYFAGTVKKIRLERKRPYFVAYDDGDKEWVSLAKENFRFLRKKVKNQQSPTASKSETFKSKDASRNGGIPKVRKTKRDRHDLAASSFRRVLTEQEITSPELSASTKSVFSHDTVLPTTTPSSHPHSAVAMPHSTASSETTVNQTSNWVEESVKRSDSDSETDEEEVRDWAAKMFGIRPPPIATPTASTATSLPRVPPCGIEDFYHFSSFQVPISEKVKRRRQTYVEGSEMVCVSKKVSKKQKKAIAAQEADAAERRRREANRPLTRTEIQDILRIEDNDAVDGSNYVRRSVRQPNRAALSTHGVRSLIEKLQSNDTDMIVLKMKKYCNDPDTPPMVIDAALDALEVNTNCEALYIQNFNQGMRDEQVMRLIKILQLPSCKIWCLNIGENYQVKMKTWEKFTKGLRDTKITHMYASEHTITPAIKDQMRTAIRENRKKHDMHNNPDNLDTIVQCTHCWYNPINAKRLQPYLKKKGYDHILMDVEAQGLKGTVSGAFIK